MMRRLREIPCRMLARTAVQPCVLVALIQFATMTTEVVEVATESKEDVIINCVAIFYEEGKEGEISEELYVLTIVFSTEREVFTRQKGHNSRKTFIPRSTTSTGSTKVISHLM